MRQLVLFLVRVFFLQLENGCTCVICGKHLFYIPICKNCRNLHFAVDKVMVVPRCKTCGKELISTKNICLQCFEKPILKHSDFVLPLFSYRLWNKQLMFMWKKKEMRSLSWFFAEEYRTALKKIGSTVIVPVPPRPGKIQEKGWDQIDEVCGFLKYFFGFRVFDVLMRISVSEQKKLNRVSRLENIENAYCLKNSKKIKRVMKRFKNTVPDEVCIIDDVSTTGATLESCAKVLKDFGVKTVNAITLFIVD